jgi:hypothetical protein
MSFNYDIEFVVNTTKFNPAETDALLQYFATLPMMAKLEVFYIMQLIEEEDEFAFLQHYFDKSKTAEYKFSLFLLSINRLYLLESYDTKNSKSSSYKLNKINMLKNLRSSEEK